MSFAIWLIIIGALLITITLSGTSLKPLPLSTAMLYLAAGYGLGGDGLGLVRPDLLAHPVLLERVAEAAVLISLFGVGLKLGLPLSHPGWRLPLRLALVSMTISVALVAAIGVFGLGLSLGAAILLGAILAPTDPVLASDVQVLQSSDRDRLRFSLTGEGGLNDGAAFPFVMLGLGLIGLHDLGAYGWRWVAVDVLWAILGGLALLLERPAPAADPATTVPTTSPVGVKSMLAGLSAQPRACQRMSVPSVFIDQTPLLRPACTSVPSFCFTVWPLRPCVQ